MARLTVLNFLLFFALVNGQESVGNQVSADRNKRLFSLFSVVTFPNNVCTGSSGDMGTCYSNSECTGKSGTASGNCAAGFGVCCTFTFSSCGDSVKQNTTYITNPSYPSAYTTTTTCSFSVTPLSSDICQIRLDFDTFDLAEATTGACTDSFDVTSGSSRLYPTLCGTLTGQHIYIETGRKTTAHTLKFTVASSVTFKAKVSQIECFASYKAPSDCFQYYTGVSGRVKSFNFASQVHLWNMRYTACIRAEEGYCGIQWHPTSLASTNENFTLAPTSGLTGASAAPAISHIVIPGSIGGAYSGTNLATPAQTSDGAQLAWGRPFTLSVLSTNAAQTNAKGFDLTWNQAPCASGSI